MTALPMVYKSVFPPGTLCALGIEFPPWNPLDDYWTPAQAQGITFSIPLSRLPQEAGSALARHRHRTVTGQMTGLGCSKAKPSLQGQDVLCSHATHSLASAKSLS